MNLQRIYEMSGYGGISDTYTLTSNMGVSDGYDIKTEFTDSGFVSHSGNFTALGIVEEADGVFSRCDIIKNTSSDILNIYDYKYRFCIFGGETEVYTQYNNWQNESDGEWQKLITSISAEAEGVRLNENAAPMAAVWNNQTKKV